MILINVTFDLLYNLGMRHRYGTTASDVIHTGWIATDTKGSTDKPSTITIPKEDLKYTWCFEAKHSDTYIQMTIEYAGVTCYNMSICHKLLNISDYNDEQFLVKDINTDNSGENKTTFYGTVIITYSQTHVEATQSTNFSVNFTGTSNT